MTLTDVDQSRWEEARLIPVSGINGAQEQENRASSALLAVIRAVPDFAKEILDGLGAPVPRPGKYRTYTQVHFKLGERNVIPDGIIQIDGVGGKTWTCLIEFKTGPNHLEPHQIEDYLNVAKTNGYQCVLTISNEIAAVKDIHPCPDIDKRKLKTANLHHISWSEILQKALVRQNFAGVTDIDQKWILEELIRYLRHEKSGASGFTDMGPHWVTVRNKVADNTLRPHDREAIDVIERFDTLMRFLAIKLTSQIGLNVSVHYTKAEHDDRKHRINTQVQELCTTGILTGELRIPNTVSILYIRADLRRERIDCLYELSAPNLTKETAKVNWLTRQLKDLTTPVQLEAYAKRAKDGIIQPLAAVLIDPKLLIESGKEVGRFEITTSYKLGRRKDNAKDSSFIDSMLTAAQNAYDDIGTRLKTWQKPPTPRYIKPDPSPLDEITIRDERKEE